MYQILSNCDDDYELVAQTLKTTGGAVFPFAYDSITCHNVVIISNYQVLGKATWGGNPAGKFIVGIYLKGCFHFDPFQKFDGMYFAEKLGLSPTDATPLAEFFNGVAKAYIAN